CCSASSARAIASWASRCRIRILKPPSCNLTRRAAALEESPGSAGTPAAGRPGGEGYGRSRIDLPTGRRAGVLPPASEFARPSFVHEQPPAGALPIPSHGSPADGRRFVLGIVEQGRHIHSLRPSQAGGDAVRTRTILAAAAVLAAGALLGWLAA